ncbi:MAG TPA: hypothetical protein VJ206_01910 [bacterium]|jgi:hypothetical protein|nr:hypothetical protein [bacterium]
MLSRVSIRPKPLDRYREMADSAALEALYLHRPAARLEPVASGGR